MPEEIKGGKSDSSEFDMIKMDEWSKSKVLCTESRPDPSKEFEK